MPSIKDESTVQAIAREFTSNGRKKGKALQETGYSDAYSIEGGRGSDVVFSNVQVVAAIKAIDDEKQAEADITREMLVKEAWDIVRDATSTKTEKTRAMSLIADMIGAKREAAPNKEKEQALAARMTKEDRELATLAARIRTEQEARAGLKIAEAG